jgi:hypothetical protein
MALYTDPRDVFEAAARQYSVRVTCTNCQHSLVFDPHELWWHFERKGWDQNFRRCGERFRCSVCLRRSPAFELTRDEPERHRFPMPSPHEWKHAINRYRA